jgi:hypothetical protein
MPRTDHYDKYGNRIGYSETYTKEEKAESDARLADFRARKDAKTRTVVENEKRKKEEHPFVKPIIYALVFLPLVLAIARTARIGESWMYSSFPSLFCAIVFLVLFWWSSSRFDDIEMNGSFFRQIIVLIIAGLVGGTLGAQIGNMNGMYGVHGYLWIINGIYNSVLLLLYRKFVSGW